jgi:hypothetical protein
MPRKYLRNKDFLQVIDKMPKSMLRYRQNEKFINQKGGCHGSPNDQRVSGVCRSTTEMGDASERIWL